MSVKTDDALIEKIRYLYATQGYTYAMILDELGVPRSTSSRYCRDLVVARRRDTVLRQLAELETNPPPPKPVKEAKPLR